MVFGRYRPGNGPLYIETYRNRILGIAGSYTALAYQLVFLLPTIHGVFQDPAGVLTAAPIVAASYPFCPVFPEPGHFLAPQPPSRVNLLDDEGTSSGAQGTDV